MLIYFLAILILSAFLFTFYKVISYKKYSEIDHSYFRELEVKSIITDVAISRKTEIKILGKNEWIRVGGCKLVLSEGQNAPIDFFLKGDSIIKKGNSNNFLIVRESETYNWVIE